MSIEVTKTEAFAAPVVDSLSVRLLVDSVYDRFIADAPHPMVKIEHVRHIPGHELSTLAGEWADGAVLPCAGRLTAGRPALMAEYAAQTMWHVSYGNVNLCPHGMSAARRNSAAMIECHSNG